ncbi:hypothetical protein BKA93DRAFT_721889 [Sparassis latifolia]
MRQQSVFSTGRRFIGHSHCAICLSRHTSEQITCCNATMRWNNSGPSRCTRSSKGKIINPDGITICTDWQCPQSCTSKSHRHECSGCGDSSHGAHQCHFAETLPSSHPSSS